MKTIYRKKSKLLANLVEKLDLKLVSIKYKFQGFAKFEGWDIQDKNGKTIVAFEPVNYSNGDRWYVRDGKMNKSYYKSMREVYNEMIKTNQSVL